MTRASLFALFAAFLGCSSASRSASSDGLEPALSLSVDKTSNPPKLTIAATEAQLRQLNSRYSSFTVELGPPEHGVQPGVQQGYGGSLELPWTIQFPKYSSPYPVRVIGTTKEGLRDVIFEKTF